jgi:hypothetical protein
VFIIYGGMAIAINRVRVYLSWLFALAIGWATSQGFRVPHFPGFTPSLMQQPSVLWALLAVLFAAAMSYFVAWVLAGRINADYPLAAAALSLLPIRFAGGSIYYALEPAPGHASVYLMLALETLALFAIIAAIWFITRPLQRLAIPTPAPAMLDPDKLSDPLDDPSREEPIDQKLVALLTGTIMTAFCLLFLARGDAPGQAMFAIFVGSIAAAWIAHRFVPARESVWFWLAPLPVALLGYLTGHFSGDPGLPIGESQHYFAALTRLSPLDYASLGVAGSIWGFQMRRDAQLQAAQDAMMKDDITAAPPARA